MTDHSEDKLDSLWEVPKNNLFKLSQLKRVGQTDSLINKNKEKLKTFG